MGGRLDGQVAIVTGGGQGIGAAISRRFAEEGARVVIAQRSAGVGEGHADVIRQAGGEAIAVRADVTDRKDLERLVERTLDAFGPPTTLVNNAGISVYEDPLELTPEQWRTCFAVDLDGAWWASQAVLPHMLAAGRGCIINIASVHSFAIIPGCFPYPVAKHGLIGLTRALAAEYGARGIRVNAICPGYVDTPNIRDYFATFPDPDAERARVGGLHVIGRLGRPDEIAGPALFLASEDASFITGEALIVDGGLSTVLTGHGIPFLPGIGPTGTTSGLDGTSLTRNRATGPPNGRKRAIRPVRAGAPMGDAETPPGPPAPVVMACARRALAHQRRDPDG
jgi:NAD(P)-dependent dehydrogenase (short-subunit alcohol dehydrogenase family)